MHKQKGFLSIGLLAILVILAAVGVSLAFQQASDNRSSADLGYSKQAFYISEAGLERGARSLLTPNLNQRRLCTTASLGLDNSLFPLPGDPLDPPLGEYQLSGTSYYSTAPTSLSSTISANATTIPVISTAGYATSGRVLIDKETIDYSSKTATSFRHVTRGADGTRAASHQLATQIGQYQCDLQAMGDVPNQSNPLGKQQLQIAVQRQEAWAVGDAAGSAITTIHWNRPSENQWSNASQTSNPTPKLNAISMASYVDGWSVGDATGNGANKRFNLFHWDPILVAWKNIAGPIPSQAYIQNLNAAATVSANEAWASGDVSSNSGPAKQHTFLRWNGSAWCLLGPGGSSCSSITIPTGNSSVSLYGIDVIDSNGDGNGNLGFAVGQGGTILRFDGTQWTADTSPTANDLNAVFIISAQEAWAVGRAPANKGQILRWNGSTWSIVATADQLLNSIHMLDTNNNEIANLGWAVGKSGHALHYNGSNWSIQNIGGTTEYNDIAISGPNDAWAVGNQGKLAHWNGSAWTTSSIPGMSKNLNAISSITPNQHPQSHWGQA